MYRPENMRKWIAYDDGGHEPVALHENISEKRHDSDREWFVVDKPSNFRPDKLAHEAFHPRHKNEEYMRYFIDPHATRRTTVASHPQHTISGGILPERMDEIPHDYTEKKDGSWGRLESPKQEQRKREQLERERRKNADPWSTLGHAAVDLATGVVRRLENGFDPNKKPAPDLRQPTVKSTPSNHDRLDGQHPAPIQGTFRNQIPSPTKPQEQYDMQHRQHLQPSQMRPQPQATQTAKPSWGKPGSLLSDPTRWLHSRDAHPAPVGKLERAEQRQNAKGPLERMYEGTKQAVSKGWDVATSKEVRQGAEFGARAAWEVTKDVAKIAGEDAVGALIPSLANVSAIPSFALDKYIKLHSTHTNFDHEYARMAKRLAERIQRQHETVYGPGRNSHVRD